MPGSGIDEAWALHTRSRRYLINRYGELTRAYSSLPHSGRAADGYHYTDEAKRIFPRYQAVEVILVKIEELDSDALPPIDELKRLLVSAGNDTRMEFMERRGGPAEEQAIAEERRLFAEQVVQLAIAPGRVDALPYRRTLTDSEAENWLGSLQRQWGVVGHEWYPMLGTSVPEHVLVLRQEGLFDNGDGEGAVRSAVAELGVTRVIELREFPPSRMIDVASFTPSYNGAEGLWTDDSLSWIAYASHHETVAFDGNIIPFLHASWPGIDRWKWEAGSDGPIG